MRSSLASPRQFRLTALFALLAFILCLGTPPVRAGDSNPTLREAGASGYDATVVQGQPFFLLSDASFGSDQVAQVRLETTSRWEQENYGGVDIVVYKVPNPLAFLKAQKNLHRLDIKPNYQGEGLANTLGYLWDRWNGDARRSWQRVLSYDTRSKATAAKPEFKRGNQPDAPTRFEPQSRFAPLPGYDLVTRFRYPIWEAKSIQPPKGVDLAGSSSNFIAASEGNVMIPVGKLPPGLYLVEAIIGNYRAHTLLFVSDTVAAVKSAPDSLLVWTARRDNGKVVPNAQVSWTDGVGVLQSGATGADGALLLQHVSPERSYVIGSDPQGGVFVSENFYYDSEIYNTKIYAITDRPLYRPGDTVHVKLIGRAFQSADQSTPAAPARIKLNVLDPNGAPVATRAVDFTSQSGGDATFALPANAPGGGYSLRFDYNGDTYGGAFRVAEYVKPHFDVNLVMDKSDYATGEAPKGKIALRYPDGKPVKNGKVSVTLRAQKVAIADGELRYAGLFPVKLNQQELQTDSNGNATLTLPAAAEPSRYALTVFAQDGAAYRVRVTREILIARGAMPYRLSAAKSFSQPREAVTFTLAALANASAGASTHKPARWEWVRLESQTKASSALPAAGADGSMNFPVQFDESGSYMLSVKDDAGNLIAAASHWVAGDGLKAIPGSVEIVFDRDRYQIGETAEALITFPDSVDDALLTLERDSVEARALLSQSAGWVSLTRVAPAQWKARIKVAANFAPNMTFSVLYVRNGEYVFQNAGIMVTKPAIQLTVKSDKPVYAPGETVTLDLDSALGGKALPARLTVSVVDEMVYVLQPEIAPDISEFFYHLRRNNVRTSSSLSFIAYDLALSALRGAPGGPQRGQYNERGVKVLERPRRDEVDTAAWQADLQTDANGHARMTFRMPDSLTRWRVTVRAISGDGAVGQRTAYVRSDKPLYLKWSGPARFRLGDQPVMDMLAFNQGAADVNAQWSVKGAGFALEQKVTLKPGANYLTLPRVTLASGQVDASLSVDGKPMDRLQTAVSMGAPGWLDLREMPLTFDANPQPLTLAPDAQDVRVRFVSSNAQRFARVADDLIAYPYGCAEQTSSRLIPLALAYETLGRDLNGAASPGSTQSATRDIEAMLRNERQRLAFLAGLDGTFGWWGDTAGGSALITSYAYYADWLASRSLGIALPDRNWQRAAEIYRDKSADEPLLHRALALWLLQQTGQPVATPVSGVAEQLAQQATAMFDQASPLSSEQDSLVFAAPDSPRGLQVAVVLTAHTARAVNARLPDGFDALATRARAALMTSQTPLAQSLLAMTGNAASANIDDALTRSSAAYPTVDRALTLLWLRKAMNAPRPAGAPSQPALQGKGWARAATPLGMTQWTWTGAALPVSLDIGNARSDVTALVSYRSRAPQKSDLPVKIERALYRLDPVPVQSSNNEPQEGRSAFQAHRMKAGEAIDSNALYVDEITLAPAEGKSPLHYGLLEAPLPPGGSVEGTSWGMSVGGLPGAENSSPQPFARAARHEMGSLSYHQPVPLLDRPLALRQLVRFALPGTFTLPPARYFRMYQPEQKAYEGGRSDHAITLRVQ